MIIVLSIVTLLFLFFLVVGISQNEPEVFAVSLLVLLGIGIFGWGLLVDSTTVRKTVELVPSSEYRVVKEPTFILIYTANQQLRIETLGGAELFKNSTNVYRIHNFNYYNSEISSYLSLTQ